MHRLFLVAVALLLASIACGRSEPDDSAHRQAREEGAAGAEVAPAAEPAARPEAAPAPPPAPSSETAEVAPRQVGPSGNAHPALLDPSLATETAPAQYSVRLDTTKGDIFIDVTRAWAPVGADRFYNLVRIGYLNDVAFFRVIEGFMGQVGLSGDPAVNAAWRTARIQDDPPTQSNTRGMVSFATSGTDSRVQQFFFNFSDNSRLDGMGFAPFGRARDMRVVDALHSGYGEGAPGGRGPSQALIQSRGNAYLRADFPELDYIRGASIVTD